MYICNNCGNTFEKPYVEYDEVGDEWYEAKCPYCLNENIEEVEFFDNDN